MLKPSLMKIGILLILLLPALLAIELAIVRSRPEIPGQQVVVASDGSLKLDPLVEYVRDPTLPEFSRYLFPVFAIAFIVGVALLVTSLIRWLAMRRRTI